MFTACCCRQVSSGCVPLAPVFLSNVQQNITIARAFKNEVVKYIKWFNDNKTDMLADMNPKDVVWIFQTMTSLERQMNEDLIGNEKAAQSEKEQIIFTFER